MCSKIEYHCYPFKSHEYQEYLITATHCARSKDEVLASIHICLGNSADECLIPQYQGSTIIIRKLRMYETESFEIASNLLSIVEDIAKKYKYQKIIASPVTELLKYYIKSGYKPQGRYIMKTVDLPASHYILVVSILTIVYAIGIGTLLYYRK